MIAWSDLEPGRDNAIKYTGLRPGEKLFEELFYASEVFTDTPNPRIKIARRAEGPEAAPSWT